jgi:hypothetical protein
MEGKALACTGVATAPDPAPDPAPPAATRHDPVGHAVSGPHQQAFEYTAEEQAIIEKRLADLGYLE